ncbi:hypothetical protein BG418_34505 [Streptomyces sp. CBMA152]|nr:hypothetical protein [Streptomyces sp. CBMA152]MBD0746741.1 hypothetical protein [Streptomyces sp. CBMA152]
MDDPSIEVGQGFRDVCQDAHGLGQRESSLLLQVRPQRLLRTWHDEYPLVLVLAVVEGGNNVADTIEFSEQQLPLSARALRDQLYCGGQTIGIVRRVDGAESARLTDRFANDPFTVQFKSHEHAPRHPRPHCPNYHAGAVRHPIRVYSSWQC